MLLSVKVKVIKKSNGYEEVNLNGPMSHVIIMYSNTHMWCSCSPAQFGTPQRTPDRKWFALVIVKQKTFLSPLSTRPQSRTVQLYVISLEHMPPVKDRATACYFPWAHAPVKDSAKVSIDIWGLVHKGGEFINYCHHKSKALHLWL